jgi:hypothetical protein
LHISFYISMPSASPKLTYTIWCLLYRPINVSKLEIYMYRSKPLKSSLNIRLLCNTFSCGPLSGHCSKSSITNKSFLRLLFLLCRGGTLCCNRFPFWLLLQYLLLYNLLFGRWVFKVNFIIVLNVINLRSFFLWKF